MPRTTDTRERMVKTAARLFRRQGYAATGWRQIVADGATPWGSQSHHFPGGKEQLAVEALAFAGQRYERLIRGGLVGVHPADFVSAWAELAAAELAASGWADGCPVATVALETAHESDPLASACDRALSSWCNALAEAIAANGARVDEAGSLATFVIAAIEGGLLLARTQRRAEPLHSVGRELSAVLARACPRTS